MTAPQNVGILAMEVYFPKRYVNQTELEQFDKAPAGKYTVGLGQTNMAYVGDREDINSICLSAVKGLMEKYGIDPKSIGRLEVGTETIIDKSKSVKTTLMELFKESGNMSLEGVDNINACYGGTSALFNSIQWIESSYWDGRLALVVAGDIAIYAEGNARPTGGCASVAMLIGPNAPIVFDRGLRGTHMENVYDFYKPNLHSEYPVVDGKLSVDCYLRAVDNCYDIYRSKFEKKEGKPFTIEKLDHVVFHAPYNKLVQKSLARMVYNDMLQHHKDSKYDPISKYYEVGLGSKSYSNVAMEKDLATFSKDIYHHKVGPSTVLPKNLGNAYCGSLYVGLCSLVAEVGDSLVGKRVGMFSYGSGLASSLFSFQVVSSIQHIVKNIDMHNRLAIRSRIEPSLFVQTLKGREQTHGSFVPVETLETLPQGAYYLTKVDEKMRRHYSRLPLLSPKL